MQANKTGQELSFSVGDLVLLSTTNLNLPSYTRKKFQPCWIGPFEVEEVLGVSYRLTLPPTMKVHPVFHSSLLKRWNGPPPSEETPDVIEGELEYEVE